MSSGNILSEARRFRWANLQPKKAPKFRREPSAGKIREGSLTYKSTSYGLTSPEVLMNTLSSPLAVHDAVRVGSASWHLQNKLRRMAWRKGTRLCRRR